MVDAQQDVKKLRPVYRNIGLAQLVKYRLPWAGKVSILHRISGAALFLLLPFILYLFDQSLASELSYQKFQAFTGNILVKIICLGLIWAFLHHFCAGIRYLLLDLELSDHRSFPWFGFDSSSRPKVIWFLLSVFYI